MIDLILDNLIEVKVSALEVLNHWIERLPL